MNRPYFDRRSGVETESIVTTARGWEQFTAQRGVYKEASMRGGFVVIGGIAVALAVGGCATAPGAHARWHTGWDKPGMTGEAFEADVRDCDREANRVAALEPGHRTPSQPGGARTTGPGSLASQRQIEHERAYSDCMKSKGYTATK